MRAVVTLSRADFAAACRRLAREVRLSGVDPQVMVGIRTGGLLVAREMAPALPGVTLMEVTLRRPSTRGKGRFTRLIRALPLPVADTLRRVEARVRMAAVRRRARRGELTLPQVTLPDALTASCVSRVLVVDDATDTGVTLAAVTAAICRALPRAVVTAAVLVGTEQHPVAHLPEGVTLLPPVIAPGTLVRFPWSADSRQTDYNNVSLQTASLPNGEIRQ